MISEFLDPSKWQILVNTRVFKNDIRISELYEVHEPLNSAQKCVTPASFPFTLPFFPLCPASLPSAPIPVLLIQHTSQGGPSCLSWVQNPFPSLYLQVRQNMSGRCFHTLIGDALLFSSCPRHRYLFLGWFSQLSSTLHSGTPGSETRLHPSVFCSGLILFGSQFIDIPPRTLDPNTHFYKWGYFLVTKTNASHPYTIYILKWFWHFGILHGQVLH